MSMRRRAILAVALGGAIVSASLWLVGGSGASRPSAERLGLGFRGRVLLGFHVEVEGAPAGSTFVVANPEPVTSLLVESVLEGPSCTEEQRSMGQLCPPVKRALLRLHVSALLDFREQVPVDSKPRTTLTRRGEGHRSSRISLGIPRLDPGRHCLLVAAIQDAKDAADGRFRQYRSAAAFVLTVKGSAVDHCRARPLAASRDRTQLPTPLGCGEGVLTARADKLTLNRKVSEGTPLWAYAPMCPTPATAVFAMNETLLGSNSVLAPFALPRAPAGDLLVRLPALRSGSYNEIIIQDAGSRLSAVIGEAVSILPR